MRRGFGNPRRETAATFVQNRSAELKKRFATYRTLLQTEGPTKFFEPLPSVKRDQIRKYAEKQRLNAPPEKAQAWHTWEMMQDKFVESQDYDYQKRFMTWLMGKGLEEDHKLTPWGREAHALLLPEVRAWIEQMIDAASITENYLAKLLFRGPQSLEEYAIYYKYLLHMEEYLTTDDAWIFIEFPELYNGYHLTRGPDAVMPGPPADRTDNFELGKMGKEGQERILDIRETAAKLTQKFNDVALAAEYKAATAEERRRMEEERERELAELAATGMQLVDVDQDIQDAAVQLQVAADIKAQAAAFEAKQAELRLLREERRRLEEDERRRTEEAAKEKQERKKEKAKAAEARDEQLLRVLQGMEEKFVRRAGPMEGVEPAPADAMDVVQPPAEPPTELLGNKVEPQRDELDVVEGTEGYDPGVPGVGPGEYQGDEDWYTSPLEPAGPVATAAEDPVLEALSSGDPALAAELGLDPMQGVEFADALEALDKAETLKAMKVVVSELVSSRAAELAAYDKHGRAPLLDAFEKLQHLTADLNLPDNFLRKTFNLIEAQMKRQTKPRDGGDWTDDKLRDAMTVFFRRYSKRMTDLIQRRDNGDYTDSEGNTRTQPLFRDIAQARDSAFLHFENRPLLEGKPVIAQKKHKKTAGESSSSEKQKAKRQTKNPLPVSSIVSDLAAKIQAKAGVPAKASTPTKSRESSSDEDYLPSKSSTGSSSGDRSRSPRK